MSNNWFYLNFNPNQAKTKKNLPSKWKRYFICCHKNSHFNLFSFVQVKTTQLNVTFTNCIHFVICQWLKLFSHWNHLNIKNECERKGRNRKTISFVNCFQWITLNARLKSNIKRLRSINRSATDTFLTVSDTFGNVVGFWYTKLTIHMACESWNCAR